MWWWGGLYVQRYVFNKLKVNLINTVIKKKLVALRPLLPCHPAGCARLQKVTTAHLASVDWDEKKNSKKEKKKIPHKAKMGR